VSVDGVRVETAELDSAGTRQIGPRHRATEFLSKRRSDIEAAVGEACEIVQESAAKLDERHGCTPGVFHALHLPVKVGLTRLARGHTRHR
jgi:hypothetical protein